MRVAGFICGVGVSLALAGGEAWTAQPGTGPVPPSFGAGMVRPGSTATAPAYATPPFYAPPGTASASTPASPGSIPVKPSQEASSELPKPSETSSVEVQTPSNPTSTAPAVMPYGATWSAAPLLPPPPGGWEAPWHDCDPMPPAPEGTAPAMIGPGFFYSATRLVHLQSLTDGSIFPATVSGVPIVARSQFYIGVNESPQPQDRIFLTFNWFHNVNKDALSRVPENALIRDLRLISKLEAFYETFGFEKTLWDNRLSVGIRVPFFQLQQREPKPLETGPLQFAEGLDQNTIGDASIVLKAVLAYDPVANNLISGGVVVTLPTAPEVKVYDAYTPAAGQLGRGVSTTIFQPWLGWFLDIGPVYVHGFSAISIPVKDDDVYVWFISGGVGWCLTPWFVPTLELHYFGPVNEDSNLYRQPIGAVDQLILTTGFHVPFYDVSTITLGLSTPLTGPDTYDVGIVAQLNVRF